MLNGNGWLASVVPVFAAEDVARWLSLRPRTRRQYGRPRGKPTNSATVRQGAKVAPYPPSTAACPDSVPAFARAR
jgi:hypothetical protein